jgi:SAM-dependent methyltransferase
MADGVMLEVPGRTGPGQRYRDARRAHWDAYARGREHCWDWSSFYHRRLLEIYQSIIVPGQRVLEIGSGLGHLLAGLKPSCGVGVDFSPEMIRIARQRYPHLKFIEADAHSPELDETFDVVVLSDLVNDLWDVQAALSRLTRVCTPRTRVVMNFYSRLWQVPLGLAHRLGLARPTLDQNWLTLEDIKGFLYQADFEVLRSSPEILWPLGTPLIAPLCNKFLAKFALFRWAALTHVVVARPKPQPSEEASVSVIVPARNEAGHIPDLIRRIPEMGRGTEIIFVEGHSTDQTMEAIQRAVEEHPQRRCKVLKQTGKGKADAVRLGFAQATGEVLMILDADLTVAPEDLPRFYEAIRSGKSEFANGVRLVYPMQQQAMRFFNLLGNKAFSLAFTWLLGQPVKDTLCGTKALRREDYQLIAANRSYFGDFDPFGDFDLLFGAAKLNIKITDVPVRYGQRTYGTTNINRWRHGWLLIRMVVFGARRLKFR